MEYALSSIFAQAAARGGILAGLIVVAAFAFVAVAAYYAKARIDAYRTESAAASQDRVRDQAAREQERQMFVAEIRASREQTFKLMENHLAHDMAEREELAKVMVGIHEESRGHVEILRGLVGTVEAMRTEEAAGRGKLHERLQAIELRVAAGAK